LHKAAFTGTIPFRFQKKNIMKIKKSVLNALAVAVVVGLAVTTEQCTKKVTETVDPTSQKKNKPKYDCPGCGLG
jgi:hypothetical protein